MPTVDHPKVRASAVCPLCMGSKAVGLVACWTCYRIRGLRHGIGPIYGTIIAKREAFLCSSVEG